MTRVLVCALALCAATPILAQQPSSAPTPASQPYAGGRFGAIFGTVADSLHGGPLADATVTVTQLPRKSALTAASGAFRIDSLPPGKYTLEVQHSTLDSLGVRVISDTVTVTGGALHTTFLGLPSPATVATILCSPLKRRLGPAVIVGQVRNAEKGTPVAGAEVSAAWVETQVDVTTGVHSVPNVRKTTTEADGTYRLCGIPSPFAGSIQALQGESRTAEVRIETGDAPFTIRSLYLPPPNQSVAAQLTADTGAIDSMTVRLSTLRTGPATLTGRIMNKGGIPIADALVTVQGSVSSAKAAKDGSFTLTHVPIGTQLILARRVGYIPVELPVDILPAGPNVVTVQMTDYHPPLAPVAVKAPAPSELKRVGFDRRKRQGMGQFMTEEDIDKTAPTYTSDVLRRILGLHVLGSGSSATLLSSRGEGCVEYLIDRNKIGVDQGVSIDELVGPREIAAIEFYQTNDVPLELTTGRSSGCALLVVWTRAKLKPLPNSK